MSPVPDTVGGRDTPGVQTGLRAGLSPPPRAVPLLASLGRGREPLFPASPATRPRERPPPPPPGLGRPSPLPHPACTGVVLALVHPRVPGWTPVSTGQLGVHTAGSREGRLSGSRFRVTVDRSRLLTSSRLRAPGAGCALLTVSLPAPARGAAIWGRDPPPTLGRGEAQTALSLQASIAFPLSLSSLLLPLSWTFGKTPEPTGSPSLQESLLNLGPNTDHQPGREGTLCFSRPRTRPCGAVPDSAGTALSSNRGARASLTLWGDLVLARRRVSWTDSRNGGEARRSGAGHRARLRAELVCSCSRGTFNVVLLIFSSRRRPVS